MISSYTCLTFLTDMTYGAIFEFVTLHFSPLTYIRGPVFDQPSSWSLAVSSMRSAASSYSLGPPWVLFFYFRWQKKILMKIKIADFHEDQIRSQEATFLESLTLKQMFPEPHTVSAGTLLDSGDRRIQRCSGIQANKENAMQQLEIRTARQILGTEKRGHIVEGNTEGFEKRWQMS